jgi:catechol 2,3-dioxygenase-like lactoylglutathione lyase family enzyme
MDAPYPPSVAHVGVSVPDVAAAVVFYTGALDMEVLVPPTTVPRATGHVGRFLEAFFPGFRGMRAARVITREGVAMELFEWATGDAPGSPTPPAHHAGPGYFHVAFVDPDVEGRVQRIVAAGGRRRTDTWQVWPDLPFRACYCEDPFGNIVEVISHSEEEMHGRPR